MEALTKSFVRPPLCASASLTGLPSVAVKSSARGGSSSSFPSVSKAATSAANRTVRTFALPNDDDVIALNSGKSLEELEETIRRIAEENEQLRARAAAAAANARRAESAFKGDVDVSRPRMGAVPPPPPPEFAAAPVVEYLDTTLGGVPAEEIASVEAKYLVEEAGSVRSWQEAVEQEAATSAAADGNLEIAAAGGIEDIQKTENPMSCLDSSYVFPSLIFLLSPPFPSTPSIVFVASEVAACSNTGGLADAVGSLPVLHSLPHITVCLPPSHPSSLHQHCVRGVRGGPLLQNRRPGGRGGVAASAPCSLISPFPLCSLHPSPLFSPFNHHQHCVRGIRAEVAPYSKTGDGGGAAGGGAALPSYFPLSSSLTVFPLPALYSIVFVASEVAPYSKTGGLADVVGSLPVALAARGHRVMVVAPRYMNGVTDKLYAGAFDMQCRIKCFCFEGAHEVAFFHEFRDGVDFVFADHPSTGPPSPTPTVPTTLVGTSVALPEGGEEGMGGEGEEEATAGDDLVASNYRPHGVYKDARTILAIHNLSHQGVEPGYTFGSLGVPGEWYGALEWVFPEWARKHELDKGEAVNILKGAIVTADRIVTVSPGYAWEITTVEGGWGLDGLLRGRSFVLNGVTNGVDVVDWNPATDKHLPSQYTAADMAGKAACKAALQQELGLPVRPDVPLVRHTRQGAGNSSPLFLISPMADRLHRSLGLAKGP
ncbi:unnamed protein product [Closterium sp. NIES-54]